MSKGGNEVKTISEAHGDEDYVSLRNFARIIGVSYVTAHNYVRPHDGKSRKAGKSPVRVKSIMRGGRLKIPVSEVERFLHEGNLPEEGNRRVNS